mgnify:CR=1 FL=1
MNEGKYVFSQLVKFLPKRSFDCIVMKFQGDKYIKSFSCWNQLLIMMYGQLSGSDSLRELIYITTAHAPKSYHSTIIDLCLNLFWWANFRKTKAGVKMHTLYDVVTQIPTFLYITEAKVNDMNAMDEIPYEPNAYYIFDRGYFDFARLFTINLIGSNFVIRERSNLKYEVVDGEALIESPDNILYDQTIRLTGQQTKERYAALLRRVGYYSVVHRRTFTYITNNFEISAKQVALLYKNR